MRNRSMVIVALLMLSAVVSAWQPAPAARAATWAWPTKTVQLAWFSAPPVNDPQLEMLSKYFDMFTLNKQHAYTREALRRAGETTPMLQYVMFNNVHDPGSCTAVPQRNQVAYLPGDFCAIMNDRPDWFLRDTSGNLIVHNNGGKRYVQMDPANAGWRQFFLDRLKTMQTEVDPYDGGTWDGVLLDNIDGSRNRMLKLGVKPAKYADDASYTKATYEFLKFLYSGYFKPQGRPMLGNITNLGAQNVWFSYLDQLDGVMEEAWSLDWRVGYLSTDKWEEQISRVEQAQAKGKRIIVVAQGEETDYQNVQQDPSARQEFGFASYLLVANGRAAFRYARAAHYEYIWLYPNYSANIGTPLGPRYKDGSVWRRKFTNGAVSVDPAARTATISVTNAPTPSPTPTPPPTAQQRRIYMPLTMRP